jgi:hypothetical protein
MPQDEFKLLIADTPSATVTVSLIKWGLLTVFAAAIGGTLAIAVLLVFKIMT